ncbi:unnamed protein product [Aureobasidium mustum]|uniref:Uncharacterized protein n=1 Tax=Aureobasidium mustum TaxID=2773714 RepID=A0A9N8PKC3_9PEZI|nr:unnamed protein product [Aureobasidium mustum]
MVNPYASTVSANSNFDVQHAMVNPYSSAAPAENYLAVQQAMAQQAQGYEQQTHSSAGQVFMPGYYAPNSTMDAAPDLLAPGDHNQLVVFDPNTHAHSNDEYLALQRGYDQLQQFYSPAGQPTMPYSYGFTGPMGVAAFPPTHGPPDQLAAVSLHQAPVESANKIKNAGKLPQHKPGKECPEQNEKCHWHHTAWCHSNPKTCPLARKYF